MSIKKCIWAIESYAHLNGKEEDHLPAVEAARKEHEALLEAREIMYALGDAYDVGQRATDTSAIGRYRRFIETWGMSDEDQSE